MPQITKVRTNLSFCLRFVKPLNPTQEWLKNRLDLALGSEVTVVEIVKDQNPTGFLSQVYFASAVAREVMMTIIL